MSKEASARIKINKLLEEAGWRFFDSLGIGNLAPNPFYVYIIQSQLDNSFYKNYSEDPYKRLLQHNNGESVYTSLKTPWIFVYIENFLDKKWNSL